MKDHIGYIVLGIIILFLLFRLGCNSRKLDKQVDMAGLAEASADTLRIEPDGTASKAVFVAEDVEMLKEALLKSNARNKVLADQISKGGKAGIRTVTETRIDTIVKNITDTIGSDIRNVIIETKDYTVKIRSAPDSTRHSLFAVDTVSYAIGKDFRLVAKHSWKDLKVVELESFYVKPTTKRTGYKFWLGLIAGAGVVYGLSR